MAEILALAEDGERLMPLVSGVCCSDGARLLLQKQKGLDLFPSARAPEAALGGLWLYFGCFDEAHGVVQNLESPEGSFWHAILHRQEPDADNSTYWFRHLGGHAVFPRLNEAAGEIAKHYPEDGFRTGPEWDPFSFIAFCEQARRESSPTRERCALEIQRAEWQLLFDYCARATA